MVETDFMKLYEKLNTINEKWYRSTDYDGRLWHTDFHVAFKNFMSNVHTTGLKGLRLIIAPELYLAADAAELCHDDMINIANDELALKVPYFAESLETYVCGIPKCYDFDIGNFETEVIKQFALENNDDGLYSKYKNYDAEAEYIGCVIADYGTFEIPLDL